jgi:uncharacterized protein (TIGR02996 family)
MDETALLQTIVNSPQEDTPRLMYADWLDEHRTESDLARATAEFVRLSCRVGNTSCRMPGPVYKWISLHWMRLVPSVVALHHRLDSKINYMFWPRGRWIKTVFRLVSDSNSAARKQYYSTHIEFEFWKGFVRSTHMYSSWGWGKIKPLLLKDQPILNLYNNPEDVA